MFCAECGKTIPEGARFCRECGRPVNREAEAPPPRPTRSPPTPPPPPIPPAPVYPSHPPAPPASQVYGPPPLPPPRGRGPLISGIITAAIIVAAGLGVGLYFGLKDHGAPTAATTAATVAASTTTLPPSTTTTNAPITTSPTSTTLPATTTTAEPTTTTESPTAILTRRAADWMNLLESIPGSGQDKTAEIAAFLTPKDQAQKRAAQYQSDWSRPSDPQDIIDTDNWDQIINVVLDPDGSRAITIATLKLGCRDGLTTRGLEALGWNNDAGEWLRTVAYEPATPVEGPLVPFGGAVLSGDLLWSPDTVHELKHLGVGSGPTAAGMFVTVEFFIKNGGANDITPGGWQVFAVDASDKMYGLSSAADAYWTGDVDARAVPLLPGESTFLWFTFEVPAGLDLQNLQFRVMLPGI